MIQNSSMKWYHHSRTYFLRTSASNCGTKVQLKIEEISYHHGPFFPYGLRQMISIAKGFNGLVPFHVGLKIAKKLE